MLFVLSPAFCQQPFIQHYPIETYKGATQTWGFAQDTQGVIYVANNDGVLMFDGINWDLITLPDREFVYSIAIDANDRIFIGSYDEIGYLAKDSLGKFQYHSLTPGIPAEFQKEMKDVWIVKVYEEEVFFLASDHVYHYSGDTIKILDLEARGLLELWGRLYLIIDNEFYEYKKGHFELSGINKDMAGVTIRFITGFTPNTCLILDEKNQLWRFNFLDSPGNKLSLLPGKFTEQFNGTNILKIYSLDNGHIVLISKDKIVILNESGELLQTITSETYGNDFSFSFLYEDARHNLWVSANSLISQIITSSPLSYYDKFNGIDGTVISLGKSGQNLYVGTEKGLFWKQEKGKFIMLPNTTGEVWNFYNFHEKLYAAHANGVLEIDGKQLHKIIDHDYVHSLCKINNRPDRMIMGTFNTGIWLLEKKGDSWQKGKIAGFEEETRYMQQDESGNLWIGHYNKGVFRLQLNERMDSVTGNILYDQDKGLPSHLNNRVYRLMSGKIIVATVNGIYSFNYEKDIFEPEEEMHDALGDGFCIYTIAETPEGNIYFWGCLPERMESAGMLIKDPDGSYNLSVTPFNKILIPRQDMRVDVDAPLLVVGPHEVLIGNNMRIISYNPSQKVFYSQPVQSYIKNVWAKDSLVFRNGMTSSVPNLAPESNSLKFEFFSSFYESPEKNEFQYKLTGFDDKWSSWQTGQQVVFTNLPSGSYVFLVRTKNLYGNIGQPASFSFNIAPSWYESFLGMFLLGSALILMINSLIMLITKRIRKQKMVLKKKIVQKTIELKIKNRELSEKNSEIGRQASKLKELNSTKDKLFSIISHDLRGPVRQIREILNLIEKDHISPHEFKTLVPGLNENVRYTINLMDNLLYWAKSQLKGVEVQPTWFDLKDIVKSIYQVLKPLADKKNIHLINDVGIESPVFADKDMIKLILHNLLSNAIKFTDNGGKIIVGARFNREEVSIFVKDTGVGISKEEISRILNKEHFTKYGTSGEKGTGLGLMLCKEFIEKNRGIFTIKSEVGRGSKFSFSLPNPAVFN